MPSPILSHLIAPLTSTFFIMMASAAVQGTPITAASAPPSAQSLQNLQTPHDWHVLDSPLLRQGMERLSHRSSPSSRIHNSPYIVLIRSFLRSLLPQGAQNDHTARSSTHSAPPIGAQFLTAVLDMWLTDLDMPTPSNSQKAIATGRRGSPKTAAAGRLNHSPSTLRAAAIYTVPTTLRVTAIKVRHCVQHRSQIFFSCARALVVICGCGVQHAPLHDKVVPTNQLHTRVHAVVLDLFLILYRALALLSETLANRSHSHNQPFIPPCMDDKQCCRSCRSS